jgi:hypothetical protein
MKQSKNIKEFKIPNTLMQGLTDNGDYPALAGLSGTALVTLVGCLALVDEKNPEATVNVWFADFLDMLQSSKNCSPQCLHEAMTEVTIKLDTRYFEAHNTLGICCCLDMDYAGASVCFNASQKIKPNQTTANLNLTAFALVIQGVMAHYDEYFAVLDQEIIELYDDIFKKDSNND